MICACTHDEAEHAKKRNGERSECLHSDAATLKFCQCKQFHIGRSAVKSMNADEAEGEVNVMAKEKGRKVVLFEVTAKKADELLAKDNQTNAAIFYRVLVSKSEPMTRAAIYEASKSKCESAAAWERLGNQTHDTLAKLRKQGFVKRIETREAVEAKPKAARKPRAVKKAKSKANGAVTTKADVGDNDIPQNEATA